MSQIVLKLLKLLLETNDLMPFDNKNIIKTYYSELLIMLLILFLKL